MLRLLECPGGGADGGAFVALGADGLPAVRERARAGNVVWIDAEDATDEELSALAGTFEWHPLIRDDLARRGQRQKAEPFGDMLLIVVELPRLELIDDRKSIALTEIDMVVGDHWLVTSHVGVPHLMDHVAAPRAARARICTRTAGWRS